MQMPIGASLNSIGPSSVASRWLNYLALEGPIAHLAASGSVERDLVASGCKVRYIADGPSEAHLEDHIAFAASP
jgi:hypothetical protein